MLIKDLRSIYHNTNRPAANYPEWEITKAGCFWIAREVYGSAINSFCAYCHDACPEASLEPPPPRLTPVTEPVVLNTNKTANHQLVSRFRLCLVDARTLIPTPPMHKMVKGHTLERQLIFCQVSSHSGLQSPPSELQPLPRYIQPLYSYATQGS